MNGNKNLDQITLEDIETCIVILKHYLKKAKEVERLLKDIGRYERKSYTSLYGFSLEDIVKAVLKERYKGYQEESLEVGELTDEDIAKMKEVVRKVREKEQNK